MGDYYKVAGISDFKGDGKKKVSVEGKDILLAFVGGKYYAVGNRCPHMGGDLSAGTLQGAIVTCPRHGSQFDVSSGKNIRWMKGSGLMAAIGKTIKPPQSLPVYKVKVEGDTIFVEA